MKGVDKLSHSHWILFIVWCAQISLCLTLKEFSLARYPSVSYANNSVIDINLVGEGFNGFRILCGGALECHTDDTTCCRGIDNPPNGVGRGEWYYPNGTVVLPPGGGTGIYRTRDHMVVRLNRAVPVHYQLPAGVYRCVIPGAGGVTITRYITLVNGAPCDDLLKVTNGTLITYTPPRSKYPFPPDGQRYTGTIATYSCSSGCQLVGGSSLRTCGPNGTWNGIEPGCSTQNCCLLANPTNGVVTSSGSTFATYTCNTGYTLSGSSLRNCGADGMWSSTAPSCEPVDCGPLTSPINGRVVTSSVTTFESRVTYTCCPGYFLHGASSRTCGADGMWTPASEPTCELPPSSTMASITSLTTPTSLTTTTSSISTSTISTTTTEAATEPATTTETVLTGCPFGSDSMWNIEWPYTDRGNSTTQNCPGELNSVTGEATRYCDNDGVWSEPDVLQCQDMQFVDIFDQATTISINSTDTELVERSVNLTMQLANITTTNSMSLLPTALSVTNEVLNVVLDILENVENTTTTTTTEANEFVIDVLNNVLDENNTQGWTALQQSDAGSQVLLDNAERFGVLLARSQNNSGSTEPQRFSRSNIAISAKQYDSSQEVKMDDLKFPQEEDLVNYSLSVKLAAIQIPPGLLRERLSQQNDEKARVPIVFILFQNLEAFLPSSVGSLSNNTHGASVVMSSQVGERGTTQRSQLLEESPLSLNFTFDTIGNASKFRCVYWNFSKPVGNGEWISEGVSTVGNSTDDLTSTVQCASTHLTSFAVLVDVAGGLQDISQAERTALQVVSYIGCVISVICLLITVIFHLSHGKKLLTSVHYFVHLNLSISLLLAYFVFSVGVETAVGNVVGCAFVAALLHYLFLSSFCWMMCEGVMLYLLLVVVFSRVAKTWWFFLLLGYLIPIPFVVITLAVRWQYYGVRDAAGNLQFCWLSTDNGTIFGFVTPMLIIMMINVVFLYFALRTLWKNKRSEVKRQFQDSEKSKRSLHLAKSVLLASIVLLPLLGLTWVFGLLTVNSNTTFFAWIFTILNSLQGVAIFFFHVVRSDKIRGKIGPKLISLKQRWSDSTAVTLKRYKTHYGDDTTQSDRGGMRTKSTGEDSATDYSMGTLKSSLSSQDEMLKPDLSSSASGHYSHSEEYTETKLFDIHDKTVPFDETVQQDDQKDQLM